jgi:hypothetical protein
VVKECFLRQSRPDTRGGTSLRRNLLQNPEGRRQLIRDVQVAVKVWTRCKDFDREENDGRLVNHKDLRCAGRDGSTRVLGAAT